MREILRGREVPDEVSSVKGENLEDTPIREIIGWRRQKVRLAQKAIKDYEKWKSGDFDAPEGSSSSSSRKQ